MNGSCVNHAFEFFRPPHLKQARHRSDQYAEGVTKNSPGLPLLRLPRVTLPDRDLTLKGLWPARQFFSTQYLLAKTTKLMMQRITGLLIVLTNPL